MSDWIQIDTELPKAGKVLDVWKKAGHRVADCYWYEDEQVFKCITSNHILHRSYISHWRVTTMPEDL